MAEDRFSASAPLSSGLAPAVRAAHAPALADPDPRGQLITVGAATPPADAAFVINAFESLSVSRDGAVMIVGWVDDAADPIDAVRVTGVNWRVTFDGEALARLRRPDVEASMDGAPGHAFGYFGLVHGGRPIVVGEGCQVELRLKSGLSVSGAIPCHACSSEALRDMALSYLASAQHFGNPHVQAIACLAHGLGEQLVGLNRHITGQILAAPYVERFGPAPAGGLAGSIVVCLYGKVEFLFLQAALYAGLPGIGAYEFIYVCNSPELSEAVLREARNAALTHGLAITVVLLSGNAGFSGANNVAAAAARTDRLLFVNPDVFPRDPDWAVKHADVVATRPVAQTRLFGAPLYYDDGALMHGGMFFEEDHGVVFSGRKRTAWRLLRVEHYGKGAPSAANPFTRPRAVPAVTGAFISVHRGWFEALDGFSLDYVFGHYEDADLCLKSLKAGVAPYLHDIRMWHLEGKGSTRLPVHEGGSLINRWIFSARWGEDCNDGLLGPAPSHPLLAAAGALTGTLLTAGPARGAG